MNARVAAAAVLRIAGVWLVLRAFYGIGALLWFVHAVSPTARVAWFNGMITGVDTNLHDTYYVIAHRPIPLMLCLGTGLLLIFATKPIARLLTWKLDNVS